MRTITIVTGNKGKLVEWQRLFPNDFKLENVDIDLDEIQSLDLEAIVIDKAKRAFERVGKPVVVEDVSAGLVKLHGLPGPFIKFFEVELGTDALFKLADKEGGAAIVTCTIGYFDGTNTLTARGDIAGTVVPKRSGQGFGFDCVFRPDGSTKTFSQMNGAEKDKLSHRAQAIESLVIQLRKLS